MTRLRRTIGLIVFLGCLPLATARANDGRIEVTVDAGEHDRQWCPVTVVFECPPDWTQAGGVILTDRQGRTIPAQVTQPGLLNREKIGAESRMRELHFVVPQLNKGKRLVLAAEVAPRALTGFAWHDTPQQYYAELRHADRPVMRYMYTPMEVARQEGDSFFKVFHHLFDPAGTRFVTKGDKDGLFPHHRGLFFGFSRISYGQTRANTWSCGQERDPHRTPSHQAHQGFLAAEGGSVLGRHLLAIGWYGPEQELFAKEQRELSAYHVPGGHMVEFASRLTSTVGRVQLDGDPAHAGFQFRAAQEVADNPEGTYYLRPDGKGEPGKFRNWSAKDPDPRCVNMPWHAVSFEIDDKRYTAVYMDRPENPRESRYGERDYARFGCYFEYELSADRDLLVAYRLWLQEGEMTVEQAAALGADFAHPPLATVRRIGLHEQQPAAPAAPIN